MTGLRFDISSIESLEKFQKILESFFEIHEEFTPELLLQLQQQARALEVHPLDMNSLLWESIERKSPLYAELTLENGSERQLRCPICKALYENILATCPNCGWNFKYLINVNELERVHQYQESVVAAQKKTSTIREKHKKAEQGDVGAHSLGEEEKPEQVTVQSKENNLDKIKVLNTPKAREKSIGSFINKACVCLVICGALAVVSLVVVRNLTGTIKPDKGHEPKTTYQMLSIGSTFLKSADASGRPAHDLGPYPIISLGMQKLFYFFSYQGATPKETKFTVKWFRDGIQIDENKAVIASAVDGEEGCALDYDFQAGNYMAKLYLGDAELNTTRFNVGPSTVQDPSGLPAADIKITDDEYRKYIANSPEFRKADSALNVAYSGLRSALPVKQCEILAQQQLQWVLKRDQVAFEAGPKGSSPYMLALIQATNNRKNELLRDIPKPQQESRPTPSGNKPATNDMLRDMECDMREALKPTPPDKKSATNDMLRDMERDLREALKN